MDWLISHAESYSLGPYLAVARGYKGMLAIRRDDAWVGVEDLQGCLLLTYQRTFPRSFVPIFTPISKGSIMNILRLGQIYQVRLSAAVQMSSGVRCP